MKHHKRYALALISFIWALVCYAQKTDKQLLVEKSDSLSLVGMEFYNQGNYNEAIRLETEALNIREKILGKEHSYYAASLSNIAAYNSELGNYSEAIRLDMEALSIYSKVLGKDHPDYARLLSNLASYNSSLGNYGEAIRLGTEALNIREKVLGKEHPDYATSLSNLAGYESSLGNYGEAIRIGTEALNICEKVLGKEHPNYAISLNNLANYNSSLDNYSEAIRLGTQALNEEEKILGKGHPNYARSLNNLAFYNSAIGNYSEAVRLGTEALRIYEKVLGKDHPYYATSLSNLASYNSAIGNYSEAIRLATQALNIREKVLGKDHPDCATSLSNLASYNSAIGNYSEAIRLDTEALTIREKVLGKEHPDYATLLGNLAAFNSALGRYSEAIRFETEALNIREKIYDKEHSVYALSLNNLAVYNSELGNYNEAIRLGTQALNIREKVLGKEHPNYALSLNNLAGYYSYLGNYNEAIRLGTEALRIYEKVLGNDHPLSATLLSNIASYNSDLGNYSDAIRLETEALNIREQVLGKVHSAYGGSLYMLAIHNLRAAKFHEARNYYIDYLSVAKDVISKNIIDLTRTERISYWSMYEKSFLEVSLGMVYITTSEQLTDAAYSGLLFGKGLLLNAETELRKILLEHGDENVAKVYDELSTNRRMLRKLYEQPISERKLSTDSLNTIVTKLERQLISISKEYGDYTKNLRIDRKDVQAKLSKNDIAVEFASFNYNDTTIYCAYSLKKDYEAPRMTVCLKTTKQINASDVYANSSLSRAIWGSIADELVGVKNVYFGPSGELYNIAIESLPDWEDSTKLVSDRWNFYRLSSTRELAVIKDKNQIKQSVVYGGLMYDTDIASMNRDKLRYPEVVRGFSTYMPDVVTDSLNLRSGVDALPGTKVEANAIDAKLKAVKINDIVRTDSIGTETSFKALSGQKKNLLHIATHGFYYTESEARRSNFSFLSFRNDDKRYKEDKAMTRSGLLFAGANNALMGKSLPKGVDDGILTAQEIAQLDLRGLDLVVLSACQTGLGEITGDGVFGLQRGFKKAGAQSILMSLWKVDDAATQMLMTRFYTNLTSGMTKRKSLIEAQRYVREYETNETTSQSLPTRPYSDPKYWAAFVLLDAVE
jgi:CHAT domain-containing protein